MLQLYNLLNFSERVAVETQCNEALEMASEWIRQDEDEELAAQVSI